MNLFVMYKIIESSILDGLKDPLEICHAVLCTYLHI